MNCQPLVSVLISSYNYEKFIGEAIDSCLNQTYSPIEVVVVDDGSTDKSREIIASYGERIISIYKENGGGASAINAGFTVSRGEIICFLDSDDVFLPEKVAEVVRVVKANPDIGWYFHRLKFMDLKKGIVLSTPDPDLGWYFHRLKFMDLIKKIILRITPRSLTGKCDVRKDIRRGRTPIRFPATSGLCFTRSLLQQIVPFPEQYKHSISDQYYRASATALAKGYYDDRPLAILRIHDENIYSGLSIEEKLPRLAMSHINNAYWLRKKWPDLARYSNRTLAKGIGAFRKIGGIDPEYAQLIKEYLSTASYPDKLEISIFANAYRYIWEPENHI